MSRGTGGGRGGRARGQHGAAAVEFAIVLPLLALVLFGTVEFSLVLYDRIQLATYTRELARYASVFTPPDPDPANAAQPRRGATAIVDYAKSIYDRPGAGSGTLEFGDLGMSGLGNTALVADEAAVLATCPNVCTATDCFAEVGASFVHTYALFPAIVKTMFPGGGAWGSITLRSRTKMRCE
jgi:hypothetical protein